MRKRVFRLVRLLGAAAILGNTVASCLEGADVALGDCPNPNLGHRNADGDLDPCCIDKRAPCPARCGGKDICVALTSGSADYERTPVLLWDGDIEQRPTQCPDNARAQVRFTRSPIAINTCPLCTCGDPACVLPVGMIASNTNANCTGPAFTNFDAKPDGSCNHPTTINPNGVMSLSIQPPTVTACEPKQNIPKDSTGDVTWRKAGLMCTGLGNGVCPDPDNHACVPAPPETPSGFRLCVRAPNKGDESSKCPDGYPNQISYYEKVDYKLDCTDCGCDPPVGSVCVAAVSAFTDALCQSAIFQNYLVSNGPPPFPCASIQPNVGLQGISEKWLINEPGKCAPKDSMPTGKIDIDHSTANTFCCQGAPFDL